ncbi:MAG: thermonuclease family protein [Candidatus Omnitrophica bacterium]|nr:thermonuclease family protein [Candidatus Omnitrophota bacterium]
MRKRYFLLFVCLAFFSCLRSYPDYSRIKIIEVIDGDTLVLEGGRHLRLIGIDTPEIRRKTDSGFVYEPAPFSLEAKDFVEKEVQARFCRIEFDLEEKDKYGRLLGYCFITQDAKEEFLNKKLLEEGLAVLYTYPPNVKYLEEFVWAQKKARREKKGFWGLYEVINHAEAARFIGQIRRVRGRVLSTYNSGKTIFLNFGQDYKTDFTVAIFKNCFDYFYKENIKPEVFYKNKTIEVSGRIREYNGPEIIANSPLEIEVLEE